MRLWPLLCLPIFSACSPPREQPSANSNDAALPPFQSTFIPPAKGAGNFEVCLSDEADASGLKAIRLPPGIIFQSFGQMTGNLRGGQNFDQRAIAGEPDFEGDKYAIMIAEPVNLSTSIPCATTTAEAVQNAGFSFGHRIVQADLHLNFQAGGLYRTADDGIGNDLKEPLRSATEGGLIFGTPIADITKYRTLRER